MCLGHNIVNEFCVCMFSLFKEQILLVHIQPSVMSKEMIKERSRHILKI